MQIVGYQSTAEDTSRMPSTSLWGQMPLGAIQENPGYGIDFFDDFAAVPPAGTQTTQIGWGAGYKVYNTGSGTVAGSSQFGSTETGGGILAIGVDTAGDQGVIGMANCPFFLSSASGKLAFEARIATTQIVTNDAQIFVGLAENDAMTFGAAVPLANADAISDTGSMIGFNRLEDGLGVLNWSYADRAATWTDVKASIETIAALTWVKVGFLYDPSDLDNTITPFINGRPTTDVISYATLSGLTNLDAGTLGLCAAIFADSAGTSSYLYLDWWRCAQVIPGAN